jgi:hypothetical protein
MKYSVFKGRTREKAVLDSTHNDLPKARNRRKQLLDSYGHTACNGVANNVWIEPAESGAVATPPVKNAGRGFKDYNRPDKIK